MEEEEECQTPFQGCEVNFSLVESSVLVDRPFFNSHKQQGLVGNSFLSRTGNKKQQKEVFCPVFRVEPVVQHHRNVKEELEGKKEVCIFCIKKFLSAPVAWSKQVSAGRKLGVGTLH